MPSQRYARLAALTAVLAAVLIATGATQASSPGHNGRIIFDTYIGDVGHIYSVNADGGHVIDFGPDSGDSPAWSPDGARIVFTRYIDDTFEEEIFVMNADGSGATRLTTSDGTDWDPAWTPDGRILFSSNRDGDYEIYVMDANGDNVTQLTDDPGDQFSPVASPDGKLFAYTSDSVDGNEVWLMGPTGESPHKLTSMQGFTEAPEWSPDGTNIAFYSNPSDNFDVYTIQPDGSNLTRLTEDPERDASPAWSPDGQEIAFMSRRDNPSGCGNDCSDAIFLMNADGSNEHLLIHEGDAGGPDWQAVGKSGDTDCDEDVDAVDGLFDLRYAAGLSFPSCVFPNGDVDCDGDFDAVDALKIERTVASLPVNLPNDCPEIGA